MAEYTIDVKANVKVTGLKQEIQKTLSETPITVKPTFTIDQRSKSFKNIKDQLAGYFEKEPIPISIKTPTDDEIVKVANNINSNLSDRIKVGVDFDQKKITAFTQKGSEIRTYVDDLKKAISPIKVSFDTDTQTYVGLKNILNGIQKDITFSPKINETDKKTLLDEISKIEKKLKDIQKINIGYRINEQEEKKVIDSIHDLEGALKNFDDAIDIIFAPPNAENLATIKTKIEEYFKKNAIVLTVSKKTEGLDLSEFKKSLDNFYKQQNKAFEDFLNEEKTKQKILLQEQLNQKKQQLDEEKEIQKVSLEKQAQDVLKHYYDLQAQRKNDLINAKDYTEELKKLVEDEANKEILIKSNNANELKRINKEIADSEASLIRETAENWKKDVDNAFASLQSNGNFKKFQKELESLKNQGLQLNIDGAQEYYDKVLKDGSEYVEKLKEQNKQVGIIKGQMTRLFNDIQSGKKTYQDWAEKEEQWTESALIKIKTVKELYNGYTNALNTQAVEDYKNKIQEVFDAFKEGEKDVNDWNDFFNTLKTEGAFDFDEVKNFYNKLADEVIKIYNQNLEAKKQAKEKADKEEIEQTKKKAEEEERIKLDAHKVVQNLYTRSQIDKRNALDEEIKYGKEYIDIANAFNKQELENSIKTQGEISANKKQNLLESVETLKKASQNIVDIEQEASKKANNMLDDQKFLNDFTRWETEIQKTVNHFGQFKSTLLEARNELEKLKDEGLKSLDDDMSQVVLKRYHEALNELTTARKNYIKEVEETFKQQASLLVLSYKNNEIDFETFQKRLKEKIEEAQKDGFVSEKTIAETKKNLKQIEDAYDKSNQKIIESKEKENRDSIKKELQDTQDLYNKKLISAEEYVSRMKTILPNAFNAGVDGAQKFQNSVDKVEKELQEAKDKTDSFSDSLKSFGTSSNNLFNSLMRYFGVTQIFSAVQNSFSKMVTEVRNLDAELTEFKKVSDLTEEGLNKFIDDSYTLGESVAKTGTEVVTATTLFKKMGHTVDESMQLAKNALMWTNVADGMVSVEESANMLISTMKAYGLQAEDTTHIIDALNEVSNNYSTSSSALSNNLSTVAATLASSGVSLEQTIGLMTAGIEIMPDKASKVANGLKTISQRIRQIDGATSDKLDEFLGSKGMSRYDKLTGQLKSTYDILEEISELWPKLTINERQYFGEVMAGKNQITVLNALMMNFKTAINATNTALDSENSAFKENERVMDSIQGHINAFKSAFSELSKDIISSDAIKDVVDFGTKIIKWLDDIVKNHGPALIKTIASIGAALASLKVAQFAQNIPNLITSLSNVNPILAAITVGVSAVTFVISEFVQETEKANEAAEKSKEIVDEYFKGQKDTADEAQKSIKDVIEEYEELSKELLSTQDKEKRSGILEQLQKVETQLKNQGISVDLINGSYKEQVHLLKEALVTQKELALNEHKRAYEKQQINFNPVEDVASKNIDTDYTLGKDGFFGNAFKSDEQKIEEATKNINNIVVDGIKKTKETLANGQKAIVEINGKTVEEVLNDTTLSKEQQIKILEDAVIVYNNFAEQAGLSANRASELIARGVESGNTTLENTSTVAKETFETQETVFKNQAAGLIQIINSMRENAKESEDILTEQQEVVTAKLDAMDVSLNNLSSGSLLELQQIIENINIEGELDISKLPPEYQKFAGILSNVDDRSALLTLTINALKIALANESQAMEDASNDVDNLNKSEEELKLTLSGAIASMSDYVSQAEILAQAQEDMSNTGVITAETLKKIADAGLESYLVIDEETGSLVVNTQAFMDNNASIEDNAIAKYINYEKSKLDAEIESILAGNLDKSTESITNQTNALNIHGEAALADAEKTAQSVLTQAQEMFLLGEITEDQFYAMQRAAAGYRNEIETGIAAIRGYFGAVTQARTATSRGASHSNSGSSSSSSSSTSSAEREAQQAQREAEQAARQAQQDWKEAFKIEYNKLKTYLDSELITYEQYYQALEELNQHFFAGRAEFEEEYWKYQDEIVKGRKKYLEDELKDYFQKGEKILKHQLNVEYITEEEYYDALTLLYESYYTDKEKYEEEYWKLEEEIYKLRKKQIKELEDELKDLYKEIEDLHKEYVKSLEDDLDEVETTISFAIDVIDEEIQKLKDEKTAIDEANDAREESIKLQELEDALERAKNKKVRVYKKGEGFVYEQDTTAISQAQTALDKYKQEAQHKKRLSNIDEEIKKLEEYKKEWQNISVNYKKAQDEMTAKAILGENAREEVLRREHNAVTKVGNRYIAVKNAIVKANEATIDNLEAYIGDATQAGTFSYEIERIKNKIDEIQSKTVTLQVNTSQASTSVSNIIVAIDALKNKLESQYSTQNLNVWLASYKSMINEAYNYNPAGGYSGGSGSGGDYSGDSGPSGNNPSSGGNNQDVPSGKPAIGTRVRLKQPNNYLYGDQEFEIWGYDYKGDPQIRWVGSSDTSSPTYAVSLSELEGYDENTDTNTINPGDTITEDGVYKYADQNGNYMPMDVIWEGGQKYYYNPVTGQKIPIVSGGGGEPGVYDGGGSGDDGIYYYEPIDWQGQGYQDIGEYYADYRQQMEDYYHNLYGYHASGTTGTTTKKFVINENGIEAMVTPDGTVISAPSTGYGVIKNEYTERLTDFAADPLGFLGKMFTGYSGTYQNNNNAKNEVININGNLTLPNVTDGQSFVDSIRNVALQYTTRRR